MDWNIVAKRFRGYITQKSTIGTLTETMQRDETNMHGVANSAGVAVLPRVGNNLQETLFRFFLGEK